MNLRHRSYKKELLDEDDIPFEDIKRNMRELNFINAWLGGHQITTTGVSKLSAAKSKLHICEIGCGGGDNLVAINNWCKHKHIQVHFTGIDIKPACIQFAQSRPALQSNVTWLTSDYSQVAFEQKPDIIFSSLFCHHFTNEELVIQLNWMKDNSRLGFFINDLERSRIAYLLIKWLTKLFSSSYLVKNDAPLSVARGFTKKEWKLLLHTAGIYNAAIAWKWAFRYLITFNHS